MKSWISKSMIVVGSLLVLLGIVIYIINDIDSKKEELPKYWVQKKDKVVKGNKEFLIGEYFEYDETNGGTITDINDVKWKVLGADSDGNLLIVSDRSVSLLEFGDKYNLENAKNDYIEGVVTLNEIASLYGMGNGAIDARSITVEDVDRVLGYVHNEPSDMSDYGSVVTYYELDDEYPRYEASTGEIGRLSILHNNFVWYDFDKKIWCSNGDIENCDNSVSATNSWYFYFNQPMGDKPLVEIGSLKYEMLFPNIDGSFDSYWLASPFVLPTASYLAYGYLCVNKEDVNYKHFLYSDGSSYSAKLGVRIVVTIEL